MFDDHDKQYFARRAVASRKKAKEAEDPAVEKIHREMAEEYQQRADGALPKQFHLNSV